MGERVFSLAVWDIAGHRWAPLATSPDRARVEALHIQLASFVMVFAEIVEVPDASDDAVEAALSLLPKVHPEAVFAAYFDLTQYLSVELERFMRERKKPPEVH